MKLRQCPNINLPTESSIHCSRFHPTEPLLVFVTDDRIYSYDLFTQTLAPPLHNPLGVGTSLFLSSVFIVVYVKEKNVLGVWDTSSHAFLREINLRSLNISPGSNIIGEMNDTDFIFAVVDKATIFVMDILTGLTSKVYTDDNLAAIEEQQQSHESHTDLSVIRDSAADGAGKLTTLVTNLVPSKSTGDLTAPSILTDSSSTVPTPGSEVLNNVVLNPKTLILSLTCYKKHVVVGLADGSLQFYDKQGDQVLQLSDNQRNPSQSTILLACHSSRELVACFNEGHLCWWPISEKTGEWSGGHVQRSKIPMNAKNVVSIFFHSSLPLLFAVDRGGCLKYFRLGASSGSNTFVEAGEEKLSITYELNQGFHHPLFNFILVGYGDKISAVEGSQPDTSGIEAARRPSGFRLQYSKEEPTPSTEIKKGGLGLFSVASYQQSQLLPPYVARFTNFDFFVSPSNHPSHPTSNWFMFPNESYFLNDGALVAYSNPFNTHSIARVLPKRVPEGIVEPYRMKYSPTINTFLIFCHTFEATGKAGHGYLLLSGKIANGRGTDALVSTIDACFGPPDDSTIYLLSDDGRLCSVIAAPVSVEGATQEFTLPSPMTRIWQTPIPNTVMFLDSLNKRLVLMVHEKKKASFKQPFYIRSQADVLQVVWTAPSPSHPLDLYFCGVVTTSRVYILNKNLEEVSSYATTSATSCYWVGLSLFFSQPNSISYLTTKGHVYLAASLPRPNSVIVNILCDRIIQARYEYHRVVLDVIPVLLVEPLVLGFTHAKNYLPPPVLDQYLKAALRCYPCTKFGPHLITELVNEGSTQLAMLLGSHSPAFQIRNPWKVFEIALQTLQFKSALTIVRAKRSESRTKPAHMKKNIKKDIVLRARELVSVCIHYAQFKTAYEVAQLIW